MALRRRNRPTVVCSNCKRRKSKCDKQKPACSNCVRLGDEATCTYLNEPVGKGTSSLHMAKRPRLASEDSDFSRYRPPVLVNLLPAGYSVFAKRSATTRLKPLSTAAIRERDPYLQILKVYCRTATRTAFRKLCGKEKGSGASTGIDTDASTDTDACANPCANSCAGGGRAGVGNGSCTDGFMPNSIQKLYKVDNTLESQAPSSNSFLIKHESTHRQLFEKFAKYRYFNSLQFNCDELPGTNIPHRQVFFEVVLPHFEAHVLDMVPVLHIQTVANEAADFYDSLQMSRTLSQKNSDYIVYAIILLISRLAQLSVKFADSVGADGPAAAILNIDTRKYIAIIGHCMSQFKLLRKITLQQLQCLLLLRFHHWVAPDDGDGEELEQSNILMGTIISCCHEVGCDWMCLKEPQGYRFDFNKGALPAVTGPGQEEHTLLYQQIWSYVLCWDRKLSLINGQPCLIGKSLLLRERTSSRATWHMRVLEADYLALGVSEMINDSPSGVDVERVWELLEDLSATLSSVSFEKGESHHHLDMEMRISLQLLEISVSHAHFIHCETQLPQDSKMYWETLNDLFERVVTLSTTCQEYFHGVQSSLDPYTRFYVNKIIGVSLNRVCGVLPGLLLRFSGAPNFQEWRPVLIELFHNVASLYFNQLATEYYQCFKAMFETKIVYKTLDRPFSTDPWSTILRFLVSERPASTSVGTDAGIGTGTDTGVGTGVGTDTGAAGEPDWLYPKLSQLRRELEERGGSRTDLSISEIWNQEIYPVNGRSRELHFDNERLHLDAFLTDHYSQYNLFSSFYDYASSKLTENTDKVANERAVVPSTGGDTKEGSTVLDNFDSLDGIFDPIDFINLFESKDNGGQRRFSNGSTGVPENDLIG